MTEHQPPEQPREHPPEDEPLPPEDRPRIWVASLADYVAGRLHGDWFDATLDEAELQSQIHAMLATSREPVAEEWGIFDHDNFAGYSVGEYESLASVTTIAKGIAEHGPAFAAWADVHYGDLDMLTGFTDAYCGTYDSTSAWAEQVLHDSGLDKKLDDALPDWLRGHVRFDMEAIAQDMSGEVHIVELPDHQIAVFDARI